jgi:(E)-4-hydroxy-3-methylbut-2-enyl-diphosphate synthase
MSGWRYDGLSYRRRPTTAVRVGDVWIGSGYPIRVQSMTTTMTSDVAATVEQTTRLVEAGCEIVRLAVPTTGDAESLPAIRRELRRRKLAVPLVADIHFTPAAAMKAVEHVDKIRVNPGNYADRKRFAVRRYTDAEYDAELERIEAAFSPLVLRAKELGVSMRIGANHGSLSDRIMNRYGDTPEGMVESALEFVRICEGHGYRDLILSMKASNPVIVLQVYRLLAVRMAEEGMDYPLHLGVTEAGGGADGRIKSAIGIGALLDEGLGDTIRVSLTEDPVEEIPVAKALVEPFNRPAPHVAIVPEVSVRESRDPFSYRRRASREIRIGPQPIGGPHPVRVEAQIEAPLSDPAAVREEIQELCGRDLQKETRAELISVSLRSEEELGVLEELAAWLESALPSVALSARTAIGRPLRLPASVHRLHITPNAAPEDLLSDCARENRGLLVETPSVDIALRAAQLSRSLPGSKLMLALTPAAGRSPMLSIRLLAARLAQAECDTPLLLLDDPAWRGADRLLGPSMALGGLLCDGIGDAVQLRGGSSAEALELSFDILQGARVRCTRTEFISCPSCGRTLFDLEETTARIQARTAHLKGVKIAIMGCIVNGPGEMADADFGYVGWGEDRIALFVGREMVAKDIPTVEADRRLIELIKRHGRWVDPPGD